MEFKRKQRVKGKVSQHYKEWYDETKQYRIIWRDEVFNVAVQKGYSACVRCLRSPADPFVYWGFAGRRGLYKTRKAAEDACELNRKIWDKFMAIDGRDKVTQVRDLRARAIIGKGPTANTMLSDLPVSVASKATPRLLEILCSSPTDRTKTSRTSLENSSPSEGMPETTAKTIVIGHGPARPASQQDMSPDTSSPVPPATVPKTDRTKSVGKPTTKRSSGGFKKRKSTTTKKKSGTKRSKNLRRKKSKRSSK